MSDAGESWTLRDLEAGAARGGTLPRFAALGDPAHEDARAALCLAGLAASGPGDALPRIHVTAAELPQAWERLLEWRVQGLLLGPDLRGAVLPLLHEVAEGAQRAGEVDTVVIEGGRSSGFQTVSPAFRQAIRDDFYVDLSDLRVLILGASQSLGRAIARQCAEERCERLVLVDHDPAALAGLADEVREPILRGRFVGPVTRFEVLAWTDANLGRALQHIDLVVNCSATGSRRSDPRLVPPAFLQPHHLLYETLLRPAVTRFLEDGSRAGARVASGGSLLLWQSALALEYWLNRTPPLDAMKQALRKMLEG